MAKDDVVDLVIVVALPLERDAMLRHLPPSERKVTHGRTFYRTELLTNSGRTYSVVVLLLSGMGSASAAVATTQAIDIWNPRFIFLTGITGGIKRTISGSLGDVIVAEQIVGYEPGKVKDGSTIRRYDVYRPAHELLEKARDFARNGWASEIDLSRPDGRFEKPQVHFGVVASGDKVIASQEFVDDLAAHWARLVGVEMEGLGMALAAYQAEVPPGVLFVKSISDWADSKKGDDWQPYAADVAAAFVEAFLKAEPFTPGIKTPQAVRIQSVAFTGKHKIRLCQRLGNGWGDLADYFDIHPSDRRSFPMGRECQGIWEWLEDRCKLGGLPDALKFIGREDLADSLRDPV
jgi:nucleoside phosphorylase